jgi:hypothetical protein
MQEAGGWPLRAVSKLGTFAMVRNRLTFKLLFAFISGSELDRFLIGDQA